MTSLSSKTHSPKAIMQGRITVIAKMLLQSYRRADIILFGTTNWGISVSQIDRYIKEASVIIYANNMKDIEEEKNKLILKNQDIYRQCYADGKRNLCLSSLSLEAKILGTYQSPSPIKNQALDMEAIIEEGSRELREKFLNRTRD